MPNWDEIIRSVYHSDDDQSEDDDHFQQRFNLDPNFNFENIRFAGNGGFPGFPGMPGIPGMPGFGGDDYDEDDDEDGNVIYMEQSTGKNLEKEFDYNSNSNIKKNYTCKDTDLNNYKNSKISKELTNQLLKIPTLKYWEHRFEMLTFRSIFCALSDNHKYYQYFLPQSFVAYPSNYDQVNDTIFNRDFYTEQEIDKTNGHNGHICAKAIPKGHFVYNCYDCGVDPTCCLCEHCFNKEEHSDHNVSVHRSSGDAICDCGDETSWNKNLDCKANSLQNKLKSTLKPLPEEFKKNIKIIIRTLFDFILDANSTNFHSLPFDKNPALSINYFKDSNLINQDILNEVSKLKNLPDYNDNVDTYKYKYAERDETGNCEDFCTTGDFLDYKYLIVWNDEFHNFQEAQYFLSLAHVPTTSDEDEDSPFSEMDHLSHYSLDLSGDIVSALAETIDNEGFVCYARNKDINKLIEKSKKFDSYNRGVSGLTPLHHSIMTGKEYANMIISRSIIKWFEFILKNKNTLLTDFIRHELSNTLFESANFHLKDLSALNKLNIMNSYLTTDKLTIPQPVMKFMYSDYTTFPISIEEIDPQFDDDDIEFFGIKNCSRLQYLFFFEMRFPKSMRQIIKSSIIPTISNNSQSRFEFAKQVVRVLPTIEYNVAFHDREWRLSLVETFRLQVYHDPQLGTKLLDLGYFDHIIESIFTVLINSQCLRKQKFHLEDEPTWQYRRVSKLLTHAFQGFDTLLQFIEKGNDKLFKVPFFIKIFRLYVGYDKLYPMVRKSDVHQEFDNNSACATIHAVASPLYKIAENLGAIINKINRKHEDIEKFIVLVSSYLKIEGRKKKTIESDSKVEVIDFNIVKDGVSVIHPIGSLLAHLTKNYKFYNPELLLESILSVHTFGPYDERFVELERKSTLTNFMGVADEMLQPLVFSAQYRTNFWIRNGDEAFIAHAISDAYKQENNFYIVQQGILLNQLPIEDIIDRFMLTGCFYNDESFDKTIYEEKITMILTEFLQLMYHLLTFRHYYDSNLSYEKCNDILDKFHVCDLLTKGPRKYSEIHAKCITTVKLDEVLEEVADYIPPTSHNDYGHYKLKDEYVTSFDPYLYYYSKTSTSETEESLVKLIAELKNKNQNDVVLTPYLYQLKGKDLAKFKKIGEFMRSKKFVKILYKILRLAVNSENDSHLNMTLQLIHAIILDDELYNKEQHDLKNFVQIPICNLLLTAAENNETPKYVTKKASVILEKLLLKDDDVLNSLMDCFGSDHVEEYKKSSHGKTLETKVERKRRLALKRQKKVMKKMMKQQQDFADNNTIDDEDEDMGINDGDNKSRITGEGSDINSGDATANKSNNYAKIESRCCILCKNPENQESLFGVPGLITVSSAFWTIPTVDDKAPSFMVEEFAECSSSYIEIHKDLKRASCVRDKMVINGCPHGMHYKCFKNMIHEKRMKSTNFACPLCKGKFNAFIPSFKSNEFEMKVETHPDYKGLYEELDFLVTEHTGGNLDELREKIFDESFQDILENSNNEKNKALAIELKDLNNKNYFLKRSLPVFKQMSKYFYRDLAHNSYLHYSMSLLIGSTIQLQEINDRRDGCVNETFELPEILRNTLMSLFQYRVLMKSLKCEEDKGSEEYFEFLAANPYLGFSETLILMLTETRMPYQHCISYASLKVLVYTIVSVIQRYEANPDNLKINSLLIDKNVELYYNSVSDLCVQVKEYLLKHGETDKLTDEDYDQITEIVSRIYMTNHKSYLRQTHYILKLLNIEYEDEISAVDLGSVADYARLPFAPDSKFFKQLLGSLKVFTKEKELPATHRKDYEIDIIDYPKSPRFIDLPLQLKDIALESTNQKQIVGSRDEYGEPISVFRKCKYICLHCGEWLYETSSHQRSCELSGYSTLYFSPMKNIIRLKFSPLITNQEFTIESPYLNKHGEPSNGLIGYGDAGTLSKTRYEILQKKWFNQSLITTSYREMIAVNVLRDNENHLFPGILETVGGVEDRSHMDMISERNAALARMLGYQPGMATTTDMDGRPDPAIMFEILRNNMMGPEFDEDEPDSEEGEIINGGFMDFGEGIDVRAGIPNPGREIFGNFFQAVIDGNDDDDDDDNESDESDNSALHW